MFKLGRASEKNLAGAEEPLKRVVRRAIQISDVDFSVIQSLRSLAEQRQSFANGNSWTMDSKHLPNENGEAEAVDIYPWVNGKTNHAPQYYARIAKAMFAAAAEEGYPLEWGGFWWKDESKEETGLDMPHFARYRW